MMPDLARARFGLPDAAVIARNIPLRSLWTGAPEDAVAELCFVDGEDIVVSVYHRRRRSVLRFGGRVPEVARRLVMG